MIPHPPTRSDAGFSLLETLVSLVLMLVVTGAVFSLVNPDVTISQAQPEQMDMQQRARIGSDLLFRDLFMAGAGTYSGPKTGALTNFFAPIIPRKMGLNGADAHTSCATTRSRSRTSPTPIRRRRFATRCHCRRRS